MMDDYIGFFAMGWIACCMIMCGAVVYVHEKPDHRQKNQAEACALGWLILPSILLCVLSERLDRRMLDSPYLFAVISAVIWTLPIYAIAAYNLGWAACNDDICAVGLGDFVIGWLRG